MTTPNRSTLKRRLMVAALAAPLLASSALAFAQGTAPTPAALAAGQPMPGTNPAPAMDAATPAPGRAVQTTNVSELRDMNAIRLDGRVTDVFGNAFVLEDSTGRTLVETGPEGNETALVKTGDPVSVEGRFARGQVHAMAITVGGGERMALERPGPGRDGPGGPGDERRGPGRDGPRGPGPRDHGPREHGPREHGPRHGPGGERAGGGWGGWFAGGVDKDAATKALTEAGYANVQLVDTLKHHAEFTAKDAAGMAWRVKVGEDNTVAERQPFVAPMAEETARAAIEKLGYTYDGDFEVRGDHVEADAKDAAGKSVRVELNADASLRKERFD